MHYIITHARTAWISLLSGHLSQSTHRHLFAAAGAQIYTSSHPSHISCSFRRFRFPYIRARETSLRAVTVVVFSVLPCVPRPRKPPTYTTRYRSLDLFRSAHKELESAIPRLHTRGTQVPASKQAEAEAAPSPLPSPKSAICPVCVISSFHPSWPFPSASEPTRPFPNQTTVLPWSSHAAFRHHLTSIAFSAPPTPPRAPPPRLQGLYLGFPRVVRRHKTYSTAACTHLP